jgi:DNA polymerase III sliding clamp (beta) subunit (PCNA family)
MRRDEMRFKIRRDDLRKAIDMVSGTLSSEKDEISSHFVLRLVPPEAPDDPPEEGEEADPTEESSRPEAPDEGADEGAGYEVELLSYSNRVFSGTRIQPELESSDNGCFTVEGRRLVQWITAVPTNEEITVDFDGASTTTYSSLCKGRFQTLDPSNFPFWDQTIREATLVCEIDADRLHRVLSYAKGFVSTDQSKAPHLCVCEFRDGHLLATDRVGLVRITVPGMEKSELRVHFKDLKTLLAFIKNCKGGTVEILEHDRAAAFRSQEGHIFGESRFRSRFPKISHIGTDNQRCWVMPKGQLTATIKMLVASAEEEDQNRLTFHAGPNPGEVNLNIRAATGDDVMATISCEEVKEDNALDLPSEGFSVSHRYLRTIIGEYGIEVEEEEASSLGEQVKMGINVNPQGSGGGFLLFQKKEGEDTYLTVLSWVE